MSETGQIEEPIPEPMGFREALDYRLGTLRIEGQQRRASDRAERAQTGDVGYDRYVASEAIITPELRKLGRVLLAAMEKEAGRPYDEKILAEASEQNRYYDSPWSKLFSLHFWPFVIQREPIQIKLPPTDKA